MGIDENVTSPEIYVSLLDQFASAGTYDEEDNPDFAGDPLYAYLMSQMRDSWLRARVLANPVQMSVFYNITLEFVFQQLKMYRYNLMRSQSLQNKIRETHEWDSNRRQAGWHALMQEVEERNPGFTSYYKQKFQEEKNMSDDILWQHFLDDWKESEVKQVLQECRSTTESRCPSVAQQTRMSMQEVEDYMKKNPVTEDEFMQAWSAMSGIWNSTMFERLRKVIQIQKKYPILTEIANKMGRMADEDSLHQMSVSSGRVYQMNHASKSDVSGVTVGNDLNSMLPLEMAQASDETLSDLFLYKYVSHRLQTFSYKSEIFKPVHQLIPQPAKRKGPMIVCLDTSASMIGEPEKISNSLLLKLLEISDRQKRDLYLLSFAVSVYPVDVKKDRARLFEYFKKTSSGDTNARSMMEKMFELLHQHTTYMSSDVLWITDFKIPMVEKYLLEAMQERRREGTRFYGLQIGLNDRNDWNAYFDEKYVLVTNRIAHSS